jgi:hypothetical protein
MKGNSKAVRLELEVSSKTKRFFYLMFERLRYLLKHEEGQTKHEKMGAEFLVVFQCHRSIYYVAQM